MCHLGKDLQARSSGLSQRLTQGLPVDSSHFDVKLESGNSILRSSNLKVHISVVILGSQDVRQDDPAPACFILDHSHGDSCNRFFNRHAGVHQ